MKAVLESYLKRYTVYLALSGILAVLFWHALPTTLFKDPLSTVVYDRDGNLLGARIAGDGQWRFPAPDSVPFKFVRAITTFEDQYFFRHPGINPLSIGRAMMQNIRAGEIISGGSTLTMQVVRLSRKGTERTLFQKMIESVLAVRIELTHSKTDILISYAANAPFGGNVVGLEAASWRYFGTAPENLTYGECALLAVLPNAPSLIHPGRNRDLLKQKRDMLLNRMREKNLIDSLTCILACTEPLPGAPLPLPDLAPHVTDMFLKTNGSARRYETTLSSALQVRVNEITDIHHIRLSENQVHNLSCLVMEVESGNVLAYVGNKGGYNEREHGNSVDVVRAPRSTGSILKPLLFAGMLDRGLMLPSALVPDVPVRYSGFAPKNYNRDYEGAVPAFQALERSLNIPSVIILKRFGTDPFLRFLKKLGFTTFAYPSEHYGLSLILGGAEASLWELSGVYGSLARILNHYTDSDGNYFSSDLHMPVILKNNRVVNASGHPLEQGPVSAGSIYITFESLLKVNRPDELSMWYLLNSSRPVAWKTGTSFGFRDAWAVGVTPEYLVAVWAGNADGEGRTGLTGLMAAAPVMFDLFNALPVTSWFDEPLDELVTVKICKRSGYLAGPYCTETDSIKTVRPGISTSVCPYHRMVHLSADRQYRVGSDCVPVTEIVNEAWFVLPPLMEYYYKRKDPLYRSLPPVKIGCRDDLMDEMEIVYPEQGSRILIPVELDGSTGKIISEVAHRSRKAKLFWHIDNRYLGMTTGVHQLAVYAEAGEHTLTVVDDRGNTQSVRFSILGR
ncbi:MAG: penicillin-binding protein 1C [Bacteroidales bacterium]|nr:penicillin-binding protein 1C [Bacteroidales bacterium]MBN2699188.1 penicillin-binding protein 1C [Bacteroidales bacterium]